MSLTHSIRVGSGRLKGRTVLQGIRLPGDDDLKKTGRLLLPYAVLGPARDRPVIHVVLGRVIQPGPVPVARD